MIKEPDVDLFFNDDIIFVNEDSINVTFVSNEMGILSVDLNDINLMVLILIKMILKLLFISDFWSNIIYLNNVKYLKNI